MNFLIDIILIAIVAVTALIGAKKGFVRTVIEVAGFVAAIIAASALSSPIAELTYNSLIEKPIISAVEDNTANSSENIADSVWNAMPSLIKNNISKFGLSKDYISEILSDNAGSTAVDAVKSASDKLVKPAVEKLISGLSFTALFVVLMILVNFLAKILNRLFSFSLVGKLNRNLGAVLGGCKGILWSYIFVLAVTLVISLLNRAFWIFSADAVDNSILFKLLAGFTPFYPFK